MYTATARFHEDDFGTVTFSIDNLNSINIPDEQIIQAIYNVLFPAADSVTITFPLTITTIEDVTPNATT